LLREEPGVLWQGPQRRLLHGNSQTWLLHQSDELLCQGKNLLRRRPALLRRWRQVLRGSKGMLRRWRQSDSKELPRSGRVLQRQLTSISLVPEFCLGRMSRSSASCRSPDAKQSFSMAVPKLELSN
jgi:hypothetical protein